MLSVILNVMYRLYLIATLIQIAVLFHNDIKSDKFNGFTVCYNLIVGAAVVALNYDFQMLVEYFGLTYKSLIGMVFVWVATWAMYAWYPRVRRNPFWKSCY